MISIYFLALVAFSSAAQLPRNYLPPQASQAPSKNYLPPTSQSVQSSQASSYLSGSGSGNAGFNAQQEADKSAVILKQDQDVKENGYSFNFETSNGIQAEESGNAEQAQGRFSYKGDDGNTYSITYTAGEGGFQPQGAHLPTPPPIPAEILEALEQNAKDEASGIFDDGQYRPDSEAGKQGNLGYPSAQGPAKQSFNPRTGYNY